MYTVMSVRHIWDDIGEYSRELLDSMYSDPQLDV